jgi:hypothetical protein
MKAVFAAEQRRLFIYDILCGSQPIAIETDKLTKYFSDVAAVNNANLCVWYGEYLRLSR